MVNAPSPSGHLEGIPGDVEGQVERPRAEGHTLNFFDLPREIRDMIYANFPYLATIHITADPRTVVQPAISRVCRRMRKESLDVFYGRHVFWLDLRGWKDAAYAAHWTPLDIFTRWINAIGDAGAARLRSLSFFSHNFSLNVKISSEKPTRITLRFRTFVDPVPVADGVPMPYNFRMVADRVEWGLRRMLDTLEAEAQKRLLTVDDFRKISETVEAIQPFLCRRMSLGWDGAVMPSDGLDVDQWPDTSRHRNRCNDCGYLRMTPGRN